MTHARSRSSWSSVHRGRARLLGRLRRLEVGAPRERHAPRRERAAPRPGAPGRRDARGERRGSAGSSRCGTRLPLATAVRRGHRARGRRLGALAHREPRARRRHRPADAGDRARRAGGSRRPGAAGRLRGPAPERSGLHGGRGGAAHAHAPAWWRAIPAARSASSSWRATARASRRATSWSPRAWARSSPRACRSAASSRSRTRARPSSTSRSSRPPVDFARVEEVLLLTGQTHPGSGRRSSAPEG